MSTPCDPKSLMELAKCFKCIPPQTQQEIQAYLLAVIAGVDPDPKALMHAAKCFKCVPKGTLEEVMAYLLCQIANGGGGPGGNCSISWEPESVNLIDVASWIKGPTQPSWTGITSVTINESHMPSGVYIRNQTSLLSANFDSLIDVDPIEDGPWQFQFEGCINLKTITAPLLKEVGGVISCDGPSLESFDLPSLTSAHHGVYLEGNSNLKTLNWPLVSSLTTPLAGDQAIFNSTGLVALDFPSLVTCDFMQAVGCSSLTSINLPLLSSPITQLRTSNCPLLSDVNLSQMILSDTGVLWIDGCALTASSVENVLRRCVVSGTANANINLSGGTNAGLASLSAQGQADAATLGAQLTINP